ncbi:Axin-like protein [Neolecta irregularis DAH-3]|uniref:Axin-like protein n=1 Tax=Neolecta irregularis (strain DAH-3) TaxID=1198029 RepID=A0A1U7LUJ7_NEOID|nr:Axin-like protein [Neolecta irregularis DAH-3]|eukprot:OLL26299.1 Axin-like protein [Neolecta irregularis DAH-3]
MKISIVAISLLALVATSLNLPPYDSYHLNATSSNAQCCFAVERCLMIVNTCHASRKQDDIGSCTNYFNLVCEKLWNFCSVKKDGITCPFPKSATLSTTSHTAKHTTEHTASHTAKHSASHTAEHSASHTVKPSASHTAEHSASHTVKQSASHTAEHSASHTVKQSASHTAEHSASHTVKHSASHTASHTALPTTPISIQQTILTEHNKYRALHNAPALTWSATLAAAAMKNAETCGFAHTSNNIYGENLAAGSGNNPAFYVWMWYAEIKNWNFDTSTGSGVTGHFTQV